MMLEQKEKTVLSVSVGADTEQSNQTINDIITDFPSDFNTLDGYFSDGMYTNIQSVTMTELYEQAYNSKPAIIDGVLYPGAYLFAGASKIGKSFMMLQIGYAICTGTDLWGRKTRKGPVLYLALEDDHTRLQQRLYRMFSDEPADIFSFAVSADNLEGDLMEQLERYMTKSPDTKLIIIDTLRKVRGMQGDGYSFAKDYDIVANFKKFAEKYGICVLIVHHTRKMRAADIFDTISGTNGLMAASDGAFVLGKESRTSDNAELHFTGRDRADGIIYMERNHETLGWNYVREEKEIWKTPEDPIVNQIEIFLQEHGENWKGTASELIILLNLDIKPNKLTYKLNLNSSTLFNNHNIIYKSSRSPDKRYIELTIVAAE